MATAPRFVLRYPNNIDAPRIIPDLFYVPNYRWTQQSRHAFLSGTPETRYSIHTALMQNHRYDESTIPIYFFSEADTFPNILLNSITNLENSQRQTVPQSRLWVWTRMHIVCGGEVHHMMEKGVTYNPPRTRWVARRLFEGDPNHRLYMDACQIQSDDGDLCMALKTGLQLISGGQPLPYHMKWDQAVALKQIWT